jgi:bisphosphoglycerate-independent phosphoglycerate mutase (AlkP superfamily)
VPLVVTDGNLELAEGGELADLAPSCLTLLGLEPPQAMTGKAVVKS